MGLPFIVVELTHLAALQRAKINSTALDILVQEAESPFIHLYVRPEQNHTIRCRMFAPTDGVPEDPATGSANCALTALLTQLENEAEGEFDYQITQGVEMGRPSELSARVIKKLGQVTEVYIAGSAVMFSSGELLITGAQKS